MKFFQNKKSILLIFIFAFWLTYSASSILLFVKDVEDIYLREQQKQQDLILYHTDSASYLLLNKKYNALKDNLEQAFNLYQFGFAILKIKSEEKEPFILSRYQVAEIADEYQPTDGVNVIDHFYFRTIKINEDTLTIGTRVEKWSLIKVYLSFYAYKIIFDILLITFLSGLLIYFVMKDLFDLIKIFKQTKKRDFSTIAPKSMESQILLSATQSYDQLSRSLTEKVQTFSLSLGSAIVTELRRGTRAPTTFHTILVRMDINHYTQTFLTTDLDEITRNLNKFFETARTCIERYDGLIYEYIGDEILFLFKVEQENMKDHVYKKAFSCVRDIFTDTENLIEEKEISGFITAKAAICYGDLNFVKLDQGYSFSGVPLIQTARMLSFVGEKNKSSIIIEEKEKEVVLDFVENFELKSVALKGFYQEYRLMEVSGFKPINPLLPRYYKSNLALNMVFDQILEFLEDGDGKAESIFSIIAELKTVGFGDLYSGLAKKVFKAIDSSFILQDPRIHSSLVSIAKNFSAIELTSEYKKILEQSLKHPNKRAKANAVITLSHFDPNMDIQLKSEDRSSNRLMADILYVLGKKVVDKNLVSEIDKMISHKERLFKSSGLYLCAALLKYHIERDYVYYQSNPLFNRLREHLKKSLSEGDLDLIKHAKNFLESTGEAL